MIWLGRDNLMLNLFYVLGISQIWMSVCYSRFGKCSVNISFESFYAFSLPFGTPCYVDIQLLNNVSRISHMLSSFLMVIFPFILAVWTNQRFVFKVGNSSAWSKLLLLLSKEVMIPCIIVFISRVLFD